MRNFPRLTSRATDARSVLFQFSFLWSLRWEVLVRSRNTDISFHRGWEGGCQAHPPAFCSGLTWFYCHSTARDGHSVRRTSVLLLQLETTAVSWAGAPGTRRPRTRGAGAFSGELRCCQQARAARCHAGHGALQSAARCILLAPGQPGPFVTLSLPCVLQLTSKHCSQLT